VIDLKRMLTFDIETAVKHSTVVAMTVGDAKALLSELERLERVGQNLRAQLLKLTRERDSLTDRMIKAGLLS
jgi:hypothetical protein